MERALRRFEEAVRDRPGASRAPVPVRPPPLDRIGDPLLLARIHDAALFLRAFPRRPKDIGDAEKLLREIPVRMAALSRRGTDVSAIDDFHSVGMGGTSLTMAFSWGMARWLARRHGGAVSIAWDEVETPERIAPALARILPFLSERSLADVGVDVLAWLRAALPGGTRDGGLRFLVGRIETADGDEDAREERWDTLGLTIRWRLRASRASRTFARLPARLFVDGSPLLSRREVSVGREVAAPAPPIRRLEPAAGARFLDAARAAVAVRYRELYAFTRGNPEDVVRCEAGRGLSIWCCGLLPEHRLPLRAGYGFLLVRNGVPTGYGDAYALGDRLDLSFNVFYAFRDGESAFGYARTVAFFRRLLGVRTIAVDPYQIGRENEEAIQSGAFWFYRKLGFRSADGSVETLVRREEGRNAATPGRRTPPSTLRRIAGAPLLLDLPGRTKSAWKQVSLDAVGLRIQRRMAASGLSPDAFRRACERRVARAIGLAESLSPRAALALRGLAPVLDLVPRLSRLPARDRAALHALVRAKAARSEAGFVRALARVRILAETVRGGTERSPGRR